MCRTRTGTTSSRSTGTTPTTPTTIFVPVPKSPKIKGVFKNTRNEDYNIALKTLIDSADSQVMTDESIFEQARTDSVKLVTLIVTSMLSDYQVVIK